MTTENIDPAKIRPGPLRWTTFPPLLVLRMQRLHKLFGEYIQDGIEGWIEGFQRDLHPEKEVLIWEGMARTYETFLAERPLDPKAKHELYLLLLTNTTGGTPKFEHLSDDDIRYVKDLHKKAALEVIEERLGKK